METGGETIQDAAYARPELVSVYDALNGERKDFGFYMARIGEAPVRILDVGCSTGTLAIGLAQLGHSVDAIDPSGAMVAAAQRKPGADAVTWHVGRCDSIRGRSCFDCIVMTGHAFQCLLTDAEIVDFFLWARPRLAPQGRLIFETRNPQARAWETWTPAQAQDPVALDSGVRIQRVHEVVSHHDEVVTFRETFRFLPAGEEAISISRLRFADRRTIERLAGSAGLAVNAVYGDWDGSESGPELIFEMSGMQAATSGPVRPSKARAASEFGGRRSLLRRKLSIARH